MKRLILFFTSFFVSILLAPTASAFIPRGMLILQKNIETNGSGIYQIEQEVQFPTAQGTFILKETWVVENDSTLRLIVTGTKEYKDLIHMQFLYLGGQRHQVVGGKKITSKISDDFFEKFFHFRNSEYLANTLVSLKIAPASLFDRKIVKNVKEFEYQPEPFLRLSRVGGVINYAFGTPVNSGTSEVQPGLWIEQDQFVIRKIKLPSNAEVSAENHSLYARGLLFPRKRSIAWDTNTIHIQTLSVSSKPKQASLFAVANLENSKLEALDGLPVHNLVEDFYKRFR